MSVTSTNKIEETLGKGITLSRIQPGGKDGPGNVVLDSDQPCGGLWADFWFLGSPTDPWRLSIPDIRMARNQYWPLHWHDCWIALVILDGSCLVGDWWMQPADVLISPARVEYGPVLNGPKGCQLLEIFARDVLAPGGYAMEYHDHPTLTHLQGEGSAQIAYFMDRPKGSEVNRGHQTTPLAGVPGVRTGRIQGAGRWDLGEADDPERGVLLDSKLSPGREYPPHWHKDWRAVLVWDGSLRVGDREIGKDDLLIIEPNSEVPAFRVGPEGAHLLEVARTAAAVPSVYREDYKTDKRYRDTLVESGDAVFEPTSS